METFKDINETADIRCGPFFVRVPRLRRRKSTPTEQNQPVIAQRRQNRRRTVVIVQNQVAAEQPDQTARVIRQIVTLLVLVWIFGKGDDCSRDAVLNQRKACCLPLRQKERE